MYNGGYTGVGVLGENSAQSAPSFFYPFHCWAVLLLLSFTRFTVGQYSRLLRFSLSRFTVGLVLALPSRFTVGLGYKGAQKGIETRHREEHCTRMCRTVNTRFTVGRCSLLSSPVSLLVEHPVPGRLFLFISHFHDSCDVRTASRLIFLKCEKPHTGRREKALKNKPRP